MYAFGKGTAVVLYEHTHAQSYRHFINSTFLAPRMKIYTTTDSIFYLFRNNQTKELIIKLNNLVLSFVVLFFSFLIQTHRTYII